MASFSAPSRSPANDVSPRNSVLVVDDEQALAHLTAAILEPEGFAVRCAFSAEDALEVLRDWHPQMVLLDIVLPRMNGVRAAMLMARQYPDLRIVLTSGLANPVELLQPAREAGFAFPVLAKPVPPTDLIRILRGSRQ